MLSEKSSITLTSSPWAIPNLLLTTYSPSHSCNSPIEKGPCIQPWSSSSLVFAQTAAAKARSSGGLDLANAAFLTQTDARRTWSGVIVGGRSWSGNSGESAPRPKRGNPFNIWSNKVSSATPASLHISLNSSSLFGSRMRRAAPGSPAFNADSLFARLTARRM